MTFERGVLYGLYTGPGGGFGSPRGGGGRGGWLVVCVTGVLAGVATIDVVGVVLVAAVGGVPLSDCRCGAELSFSPFVVLLCPVAGVSRFDGSGWSVPVGMSSPVCFGGCCVGPFSKIEGCLAGGSFLGGFLKPGRIWQPLLLYLVSQDGGVASL